MINDDEFADDQIKRRQLRFHTRCYKESDRKVVASRAVGESRSTVTRCRNDASRFVSVGEMREMTPKPSALP